MLAERRDGAGPYGAKGAGEGAGNTIGSSVAAAIGRAIGVFPHELPATPERILTALGVTPAALTQTTEAAEAAIETPIDSGTDPRPNAPTDPQPLRGPRM